MKIILIAGPSGSGKTTLAKKLQEHYGADKCDIISTDSYYLGLEKTPEHIKDNCDHPDSAELSLLQLHLRALKNGEKVLVPVYDLVARKRVEDKCQEVLPKDIIIVEGIFALLPELDEFGDARIYVDTDLDLCLLRRMERDVKERGRTLEGVVEQYKTTVRPMRVEYVTTSKDNADIVIEGNSTNYNMNIAPIIEYVKEAEELEEDSFASFTSSAWGLFNNVKSYASEKLVQLDKVANDYLKTDLHPKPFKNND